MEGVLYISVSLPAGVTRSSNYVPYGALPPTIQLRVDSFMRSLRLVLFSILALAWSAAAPASADPLKIVALGDSLTAGYQLPPGTGFPEQLQKALTARNHDVVVVNAGVSGDTSAGGLARFDWSVPADADALIVELGANDALRGIAPAETRASLEKLLKRAGEQNLPVLLAGMVAPPNMGEDYGSRFNPIYRDLARDHGVLFYPFFLDGVAADPKLNLADGMHPTEEGVAVIVERIMPLVERLIERAKTKS